MKSNKIIYLIIAGATVLASCKKSFLDEKPPTAVQIGDAIKTESDLADAVNGMYNVARSSSLFGRDIPVLGDELADNAYVSNTNSGRYLQEMTYQYISTNAEALDIYGQGYTTILQANRIIKATSTLPATTNVSQLKGEAYIMRALVYLEMENFFAPPFTVNPAADGVPLITQPVDPATITNPASRPSRAKAVDVYAKIISDLDSAYLIMPATYNTLHAANSEYLAKYAAKAIEARAYLYKGDYANARDAALLVVNSGGYTLTPSTSYVAYWANPAAVSTKVETIFELALNTATNNGTNGLDYIYAQAGYGDMLAYNDLYNSYTATDVRKALILTTSPAKGFVVNKYSNVTSATDKDDIKIIRYSEVLLTLAEAYARLGDNVNALIYLNTVAQKRDPALAAYVSVAPQLYTDILNERRKELAFEGLRYFDLTRLNLPVNRAVQAGAATSVSTLAIDNVKRILPIPQAETDANPNIKQNPGY